VIATDFARFCAKRTRAIAVAVGLAAVAASRVWSSALGETNTMFSLDNLPANPDIAIFASMCAVMPTNQRRSAGCGTWVIFI
jgi:hypothetical protein